MADYQLKIIEDLSLVKGTWICLEGEKVIAVAKTRDELSSDILDYYRAVKHRPSQRLYLTCAGVEVIYNV